MAQGTFRKTGIILFTAIVTLCIQLSIFGNFFPKWFLPNFALILAVFLGVFEPTFVGALLAFCVGLIFDFASGDILGPWSGACVSVFGLLSQGARRLFVDTALLAGVLVFCASLFGFVVYLLLLRQLTIYWGDFSYQLFGSALASALCSPLIYPLFRRYFKRQIGVSRYL